jgi:AraC family transcriptional regulator of adaptative response/methylated-DNA-[protein]-cysteine methyltransferase
MTNKTTGSQTSVEADPRWRAVIARDCAFDNEFVYSVKTTGVYCRPSCAARRAKPENVRFHVTCEAAERAGFRPCKRCKPNQCSRLQEHAAMIEKICRVLEVTDEIPSLDELARRAGLSTHHFHRIFKTITGVTPRAYALAQRADRVRRVLAQNETSITDAIYETGFHSSGRFYETSNEVLGMTPTTYRAGGANTKIYFAIGQSSLGSILVARTEKGVCAIFLGDDPEVMARELQDRFPKAEIIGGDAEFEKLVTAVVGFVEDPSLGLELPLDVRGTAFQQRVWQVLREIPVGTTATYSEIAERIGAPKAVRAVAGACAANKIAVAIPCHRVVRNDGNLSGYRWGVERKRALQERESKKN